MSDIASALTEIVDRRQLDIALAKRLTTLGKTERQQSVLLSGCVLLIYAALEGGVRELVSHYLSSISRLRIDVQSLSDIYLHLAFRNLCKLSDAITDVEKQEKTVVDIRRAMYAKADIPGSLSTESNITPKVLMSICRSLDIDYFLSNESERNLNQLLRFRNNIAHGDQAMPVDYDRINSFGDISQEILSGITLRLCEAYRNSIWLASQG